ncbi:MAG: hypothetical protein HFG68_14405 [Hungatella sp.]|nr:hypothetical protein [Hungatella sp.]
MKEICYNPTPQVEVRIHVSQIMQQDFKECQEMFRANPDDEKDCGGCSWNGMAKGSGLAVRLCELPTVSEKMKEVLAENIDTER